MRFHFVVDFDLYGIDIGECWLFQRALKFNEPVSQLAEYPARSIENGVLTRGSAAQRLLSSRADHPRRVKEWIAASRLTNLQHQ
jgi:hypothetical protein